MKNILLKIEYTSVLVLVCLCFFNGKIYGQTTTTYTVVAVDVVIATFSTNCGQTFTAICADDTKTPPPVGTMYTLSGGSFGRLITDNPRYQPFTPHNYPVPECCPLITPGVNSPTICSGESTTLAVTNCAGTVTWTDGTTGPTRVVSPVANNFYVAVCSIGTCSGSVTSTVTVTPKPSPPTPTVNSPTLCLGESITLVVGNCLGSVTWNDGVSGTLRIVAPNLTTSYIATCTEGTGSCSASGTATATVTVTSKPAPTPSVNSPTICLGENTSLIVSNCLGIVTWSDGASGAVRVVAPSFTTSYTASCTEGSGECSGTGTAVATVTVTSVPMPSVNSASICLGSSVVLVAGNCVGSVTWNDGTSGAARVVSPTFTTSYTATCTVGSCSGSSTGVVTVTSKPTPTVNSPTLCAGNSATLTVTNCSGTVTWSDGGTGNPRQVTPNVTTSYVATCTVGSCSASTTATMTVTSNPTPTVNNPTLCAGNSATLTVTNCSGTVTWADGGTGNPRQVSPNVTTSYVATCTVGSCSANTTATVTVTSKPTPAVNSPTLCAGNSATLTVTNCSGTVTWSDGGTGNPRQVSPNVTTSYVATCTVGSCSANTTATVTVTSNPTVTIETITCDAPLTTYSLTFTSTAGATVTTDIGTISANTVTTIPSGQRITLTATLNGCTATTSATQTCNCPTLNPPIGSTKEYCEGDFIPALTVTVEPGVQADWYSSATGGTKLASGPSYTPSSPGEYYVEAVHTLSNCKSATRTKVSLTMNPKPTLLTQTTCAPNGLTYNVTVTTNATVITADKGTISGMSVTDIASDQSVNITVSSAKGCAVTRTVLQNCTTPCQKPILTVNSPICHGSTYSVTFYSSVTNITASIGTVTGNSITEIPVGTNVTLTAIQSAGCVSSITVVSPSSCTTPCIRPTLSVGQPVCDGTTYSVSYSSSGGIVSSTAGSVGANVITNIPIGTNVTVIATATTGTCKVEMNVSSPVTCTDPCQNPAITLSGPICSPDGLTYYVNYTATIGATVVASTGTVTATSVIGISTKMPVTLSIKAAGCADKTVLVPPPTNCQTDCIKPNAGPDQRLACNSTTPPTTIDLLDAQTGQKWKVISAQPGSTVTVTTPAGLVNGMTIPGEYTFALQSQVDSLICRDTVAVIVPDCGCPILNIITNNATVCKDSLFPALQVSLIGSTTAGVAWYTSATGGTPVATTFTYQPSGVASETSTFYVSLTNVTASCQNLARIPVVVNLQDCKKVVDLALKKLINKKIAKIGDELTYSINVYNQLNQPATGVEVIDTIARSVQLLGGSLVTSRGSASITGNVIRWNIGAIAANSGTNGDTVRLSYKIKAIQAGTHFNTAEISKTNETDVDSTPKNGKEDEDDIDRQCFSVPIDLCPGEKVEVSIPVKYTGIKWYKWGTEMTVLAGHHVVLLAEVGQYTYTVTNGNCPSNGCCPIILEPGQNCCPAAVCVPLTITKKKKK